jgi:hypothetical protein
MKKDFNKTGSAVSYDRLGQSLNPHKSNLTDDDKRKIIQRQMEESWINIENTVKRDGSSGRLSEPDGLVRIQPVLHKGFVIEVYGNREFMSALDPFGKMIWFGTAEAQAEIKGKSGRVYLETEIMMPKGFQNPKDCLQFLMQLVELFRQPESHRKSMKLTAETIAN